MSLTPAEAARYARHLTLAEVGVAGQERLRNASVLCVGAGGLGSPALLYLVFTRYGFSMPPQGRCVKWRGVFCCSNGTLRARKAPGCLRNAEGSMLACDLLSRASSSFLVVNTKGVGRHTALPLP